MENIFLLIFDVFNFGLLVFLWWFTIKHYRNLPETIPVHFDFEGKADNFGSKKYAFLMPAILAAIYCFFIFIARNPELANYPVSITEANEYAQFLITAIFFRWLFLLISLIFLNMQDYMFRYSFDENAKPKVTLSASVFAVIGSLIVLFIFVGAFK